jgi:cytochrome c oxidase subunit II
LRNPEFRRLGAPGRARRSIRTVTLFVVALASILGTPSGARDRGPTVRVFEITASRFKFEPAVLEVTEGDEVRLTLRSVDGRHGFAIKELRVKVTIPKGGELVSADFLANRAGTFDVTCSEYCGSGHRDMKARLVVTPRGLR